MLLKLPSFAVLGYAPLDVRVLAAFQGQAVRRGYGGFDVGEIGFVFMALAFGTFYVDAHGITAGVGYPGAEAAAVVIAGAYKAVFRGFEVYVAVGCQGYIFTA